MANLLIQTAFLGDLLLAIPLIKGLRRVSNEPLELVCRSGFGGYLKESGLVDVLHEADKSDRRAWNELSRRLRSRRFNLIVSPHQSLRTARLVSSLRANRKIGFKTWWNFWAFDTRLERPMHLPDALRQLSLLAVLDLELEKNLDATQIQFHNRAPLFEPVDLMEIPEWASMTASPRSDSIEKKIYLAPGSQWATKRWTPEGFVSIGQEFSRRGFEIVLVGSPAEKSICARIAGQIPGASDLSGSTSLTELLRMLTSGALLVVNDSGLMHLGSVAGIPTVAIFGPTTLELGYRPWQAKALVVEAELSCRPCGRHGHQVCPIGTHACMKNIKAQEVLRVAEQLLGS